MAGFCLPQGCPIILDSECIVYSGAVLPFTGINTNDRLSTILEKIDYTFSTIGVGGGSGTVTNVSVIPLNGIAASVTFPGTTPVITIENTAPDQIVNLNNGSGINILGTYPNFTISSTITQYTNSMARAAISGGTGINYNSSTGVIINSAPDQIVVLNNGTGISITGTYPNFTINSTVVVPVTDALNGLYLDGTIAKLGGELLENTSVDGLSTFGFDFTDLLYWTNAVSQNFEVEAGTSINLTSPIITNEAGIIGGNYTSSLLNSTTYSISNTNAVGDNTAIYGTASVITATNQSASGLTSFLRLNNLNVFLEYTDGVDGSSLTIGTDVDLTTSTNLNIQVTGLFNVTSDPDKTNFPVLPNNPGVTQNGQSIIWNFGTLSWDFYTPGTGSQYYTIKDIAASTYTLLEADNGTILRFSGPCDITIPTGLTVGWSALIYRGLGAGAINFLVSGTTLEGVGTSLPTAQTAASITQRATNVFIALGALTAPSSITFGTFEQIPFTNLGATDYSYSSELYFDSVSNILHAVGVTLGSTSTSGTTRSIVAEGSGANINIGVTGKGTGSVSITSISAQNRWLAGNSSILGQLNNEDILILNSSGNTIQRFSATTSSPITGFTILSRSTGTPAVGVGTRLNLSVLTTVSNSEVGANIDCISTNIGAGTEAFDLAFNLMNAGATATEVLRLTSLGAVYLPVTVNSITAPANNVAILAVDTEATAELYVKTESGATVNISGLLEPVPISAATLTLDETHRNKFLYFDQACTVTVPTTLKKGFNCILMADTAGVITLTGATVNGKTATTAQYDTIGLVHYKDTDIYFGK